MRPNESLTLLLSCELGRFLNVDKILFKLRFSFKMSSLNSFQSDSVGGDKFYKFLPVHIEMIEKCLSNDEIVSIIFLLCDDISIYSDILDNQMKPSLSEWFLPNRKTSIALMESLYIIKNYKALKIVDMNKYDASYIFRNSKSNVCELKKALYSICDSSSNGQTSERLIMDWIRKKEISLKPPYNLEPLINHLCTIHEQSLAQNLKNFLSIKEKDEAKDKVKPSDDGTYQIFNTQNVGLCITVNQEEFADDEMPSREGSYLDVTKIMSTMEHFMFKNEFKGSFNGDELENYITETIKDSFEPDHSMLFIFIMSHGEQGFVYSHDGKAVSIDGILLAIQNSKCLNGRPVVLIIQACQGSAIYTQLQQDSLPHTLKNELRNILICMSAIPGLISLRHAEKGSFYIQTLCDFMRNFEDEDIVSILQKVQSRLTDTELYKKNNKYKVGMLPEFRSRLEKKLYLKKL